MKHALLIVAFQFVCFWSAFGTEETRIVTSRVGSDTYEFDLSTDRLKRSRWDFTKEDELPVSPRQAQDLAWKALYELRPESEKWKVWMRNLEISDDWAIYNIGFQLKDPDTGRYTSNLLFMVTMKGEVLSPRLANESKE